MVLELIRRERRVVPLHRWIREQSHETTPVILRIGRKTTEFKQGRVHVDQVDDAIALCVRWSKARNTYEERHTRGLFPQTCFAVMHLLAQVPPMVTPDHDNGIVGIGTLFNRVKQDAEAIIDVTYTRKVGTVRLLVHVVSISHKESASGLKDWLPIFPNNVVEIIATEGCRINFIQWIQIKEFLWHIP